MAQNELQIVTFEQAKRLKAAGFDWETEHTFDGAKNLYSCYCDMIEDAPINGNNEEGSCGQSAPTVALALKGFRDVKGYIHGVWNYVDYFKIGIYHDDNGWKIWGESLTYEEAEESLLDALLTELEGK